jgi:hypothetical protein
MKRFFRLAAAAAVVLSVFLPMAALAAGGAALVSTEMITRGVKLEQWTYPTSAGTARVSVIEVDLKDPYIKVDALIGKDGKTGNKQSVMNMAKEAGAVAAINGDFFTLNAEGAPFGVTVQSGEMVTSPGYIGAKNAFQIDTSGEPFIGRMDFNAQVIAADGASFQLFGVNKTQYNVGYGGFTGKSHYDRLHMYTSRWNVKNWVGDSLGAPYTVVVVKDNVVTDILRNQTVQQIPDDTYLLLAHGAAEVWVNQHIRVGDTLKVNMMLYPIRDLFSAVDGSTLLLKDGQKTPISYEIKGNLARTAVGYSSDKRFMYMVTVEKSSSSSGMTLDQLAGFLQFIGVSDAVNLDGGGSTTMVARKLGTFELKEAIKPAYGSERAVPNGLGVFTTAPKGKLKNVEIAVSATTILAGETVTVKIASAYDEYFNPVNISGMDIDWDRTDGVDITQDKGVSSLKFDSPGDYYLTCDIEGIRKSVTVHVVGEDDIAKIELDKSHIQLLPGESVTLKPTITFKNGIKREVPAQLLEWELEGVEGQVTSNGTLSALKVSEGTLTVSYDGFEVSIPVTVKEVEVPDEPEEPSQPERKEIKFFVGKNEVLVGYEKKEIPQAPQIVNGRTFLPLRAYAEILGAYVDWNMKEQKVEIKYKGQELNFWIGQQTMSIDGVKVLQDAPPFIENGRTMVPLRAAGEAFGMYVDYRKGVQSITVTAE